VGIDDPFAEAAQLIQRDFLDPKDIWKDVQALPAFGVRPIVACFEVAFARIAVMRHLLERYLPATPNRAQVIKAMTEMMETEFDGTDSDLVYGITLTEVALDATALYGRHAANPVTITAVLLDRLCSRTCAPADYAYLLERFGNHFCARALKIWPKSY
jgi:hypothetical protein